MTPPATDPHPGLVTRAEPRAGAPDRALQLVALAAAFATPALALSLRQAVVPPALPSALLDLRWAGLAAALPLAAGLGWTERALRRSPRALPSSTRWGLRGLALCALVALLGPAAVPLDASLPAPGFNQPPSLLHPLGTDRLGRDLLGVTVLAAPISLAVAAVAAACSTAIGATVGLLSGWRGGWVDRALSLVVDTLLALPVLVAQLALFAVVQPAGAERLGWTAMLIGVTSWTGTARLIRAEARALHQRTWVIAARMAGLSEPEVIRAHAWPHLRPWVAALAASSASGALLSEAALSWLGFGLTAPWISFGLLLRDVDPMFSPRLHLLAPAAFIAAFTLSLAAIADGLAERDTAAPNS
jgi:peptide/nickel transport system permease protein